MSGIGRMAAAALLAAFAALPLLRAASAPDWAQASLSGWDGWGQQEPAVQLLDYESVEFTAPDRATVTDRGVVRLNREGGRGRIPVAVLYNTDTDRVSYAAAWLVSADGRKTRKLGRSAFLDGAVGANQYFWNASRVYALSQEFGPEVGGFIAWELRVDRGLGFGGWSRRLFPRLSIRRAVFEASPLPGAALRWHVTQPSARPPEPGAAPGSLRWEMEKLGSLPLALPSGYAADPLTVYVQCEGHAPGSWADFGREARAVMEPRTAPDPSVEAQARSLVAGKADRWDRIRALTEFVQRQIVYLEIVSDRDTLAGYRPHPAADILRNRYGDCKDKVTLLISMLRAVGEDGRFVLLFAGDPRFVRPEWPTDQFNHTIVAIPGPAPSDDWPVIRAGGATYVLFDPTDSHAPLGVLPLPDQAGAGVLLAGAGGEPVRLPASDSAHNRLERTIEARLDPGGGLTVEVAEDRYGLAASQFWAERDLLGRTKFQGRIEDRVHRTNPMFASLQWKDRWEASPVHHRLDIRFDSSGYAKVLSNGMMLVSPEVMPAEARLEPWPAKVKGVACLQPESFDCTVKIALPAGYVVEELPDPWKTALQSASASVDYASAQGQILCRIRVQRSAAFFDRRAYEALRRLYDELGGQIRRPVLVRPGAAG